MCMSFPTTLQKVTNEWFNYLPQCSISSFRDLAYAFCNQFASSKKQKKNSVCLLFVAQKKGGKLREYFCHFTAERIEMGMCSDNITMIAFIMVLRKRKNMDLVREAYLNPPKDFDFAMARFKDHMITNEALDSSDDEEQFLPKTNTRR